MWGWGGDNIVDFLRFFRNRTDSVLEILDGKQLCPQFSDPYQEGPVVNILAFLAMVSQLKVNNAALLCTSTSFLG